MIQIIIFSNKNKNRFIGVPVPSASMEPERCVSTGEKVVGRGFAGFPCPNCGDRIVRSEKSRRQGTLYECPECGFVGP